MSERMNYESPKLFLIGLFVSSLHEKNFQANYNECGNDAKQMPSRISSLIKLINQAAKACDLDVRTEASLKLLTGR